MNINNLYNFKNTIKYFLNINSIKFPDNEEFQIHDLSWSEPFKFRLKKQDDKYRSLKIPNILNFKYAYEHFKDMNNFFSISDIDSIHKRLSANVDTGDFVSGEFDSQLEKDFERLCVYDNLIKLDIKNYYGSIYTHKIEFNEKNERYLSNMNCGATNGLIMGNYLSLYFAELYLKNISFDIEEQLIAEEIDCEFSYFSDDFYFYCNRNDNNRVIKIFDEVLEKYDLERNEDKKEFWNYESYNNYNLVAKYWKKVIANCNMKFKDTQNINKMYFINQIIYRMTLLGDEKLKKIFCNNFFKTKFFQTLDVNKYIVKEYDYHQLCYIFKFSPETMLYAIYKFHEMESFDNTRVEKFLKIRYQESLKRAFHDEQLYFYFAIKIMEFDFLSEFEELVVKSNNQILISYYLKDNLFSPENIDRLKEKIEENYWFQNYHLLLYINKPEELESNIAKYLFPKNATKDRQKLSYLNFYKDNIEEGIWLINNIGDVITEIKNYLELKIQESEMQFLSEEPEDEELEDALF